jgi:hypothetical protein
MKGHCLCGAVQLTARDNPQMDACHCSMCRRWGGGPFLTVHGGTDVQIAGSGHVRAYRSSDWAERGFCGTCGSHLYYKLLPTGEYVMPAGLFQDGPDFHFHEQIFIDEKPASYEFANATPKLTGAEVFAKFTP